MKTTTKRARFTVQMFGYTRPDGALVVTAALPPAKPTSEEKDYYLATGRFPDGSMLYCPETGDKLPKRKVA